ncbi:MAG TPA: AI-2E family transporter [Gemmatimonadales bacterium]|nr:AI-2E family transporter [Gemmatimonadales bacterium]
MPILDTQRQRAAWLILALGLALLWALWPFGTGLIGALVLYVVFAPVQRELVRSLRPGLAAAVVVLLAIVLVVAPLAMVITLMASEAQDMASGVIQSPLLARIREIRVGPYQVGAQIEALGASLVSWLGSSALGLLGTATRLGIELTITFFGLYYLLVAPRDVWRGLRPFIPFSTARAEVLRDRFKDVTVSTLVGTGLTAVVQGVLVGLGFWACGLSNPLFWGVVTVIFSILPVVGSGMVWLPGVAALAIEGRYGYAIGLALLGVLAVGNVDNLIRPYVYRRWAQIHPFITVIGAFAGIRFFGLLGLLIGPLAISYFFELIRMYRAEYLEDEDPEIAADRLALQGSEAPTGSAAARA